MDILAAERLMRRGQVMSVSGGKYDYYTFKNGVMVGWYSCDDVKYIVFGGWPVKGWHIVEGYEEN